MKLSKYLLVSISLLIIWSGRAADTIKDSFEDFPGNRSYLYDNNLIPSPISDFVSDRMNANLTVLSFWLLLVVIQGFFIVRYRKRNLNKRVNRCVVIGSLLVPILFLLFAFNLDFIANKIDGIKVFDVEWRTPYPAFLLLIIPYLLISLYFDYLLKNSIIAYDHVSKIHQGQFVLNFTNLPQWLMKSFVFIVLMISPFVMERFYESEIKSVYIVLIVIGVFGCYYLLQIFKKIVRLEVLDDKVVFIFSSRRDKEILLKDIASIEVYENSSRKSASLAVKLKNQSVFSITGILLKSEKQEIQVVKAFLNSKLNPR